MLLWKQNAQGKSALMIDGARRIGKSYIVEEFDKNEYKSYNHEGNLEEFIPFVGNHNGSSSHLLLRAQGAHWCVAMLRWQVAGEGEQ